GWCACARPAARATSCGSRSRCSGGCWSRPGCWPTAPAAGAWAARRPPAWCPPARRVPARGGEACPCAKPSGRSARPAALLRDQPLGGGQHLLEAVLVGVDRVLAGHHQRRGALDARARGELAGAVELGLHAEAVEGIGEALGIHAVLGIERGQL